MAECFRRAVEQAGGDNAWISRTLQDGKAPANSFDILASPQAYGPVLHAIEREAHQEHLFARVAEKLSPGGFNASQITLAAGDEPLCRLQLHEVRWITRVAIIVDDLGQNPGPVRALLQTHEALTFSVMPRLPYSRQTAEAAHRAGVEVMLHLPMQPLEISRPDISPHEIQEGMNGREVSCTIESDLASVPWAAGVNNHMGSRATEDSKLMAEVMMTLGQRHLYFVDSRTTPNSVAFRVARRLNIPAFYRSVFLDDVHTIPYTLGQLRKLCHIAEQQGAALAIGHPYRTTLAALREFLPSLEHENIELVPVSRLLRSPEVAPLAPPLRVASRGVPNDRRCR
ncbi:MAG: divergent polysaccharide deacetylase family protein [Terriglobia bacterium]